MPDHVEAHEKVETLPADMMKGLDELFFNHVVEGYLAVFRQ